jgi:hypothetical protein
LVEEVLKYHLISTEEYVQQNWRYIDCNNSDIYIDKEVVSRTEDEIQACREEIFPELEMERLHNYKDNLISESTRLFVFILLFALHFPFFLKQQKKTDKKEKKANHND